MTEIIDPCVAGLYSVPRFVKEHNMPIYEYGIADGVKGCEYCTAGFEILQKISDPVLKECPKCKSPVIKIISAPAVGKSKSGFDDRAKSAGFSKLKRIGKGEYEKQY